MFGMQHQLVDLNQACQIIPLGPKMAPSRWSRDLHRLI